MKVVIVGSIALDTIETSCDRREYVLGGSCVFASLASSFFAETGIVGVVGRDFTEKHFSVLHKKKINTAGVERAPGRTFHWEGRYNTDLTARETIKTELNVFADFNPAMPADYRAAQYLFLANIDPALQLKVLASMKKPKFVICDTMNYWIENKKSDLIKVFRKVDCVVLNNEEIREFTGRQNLISGAREIRAMGPKFVIVKKGEHGASMMGPGIYFSAPSYPVEDVIDPTGAGDSFAGAFIGYIAKKDKINNATLKKAIVYGNTVASFTVQGFSVDRLVTVKPETIEERVSELKKAVVF